MAKHLSPENENVKRGYWVAALRDMAQIMVTSKDNARDAFGEIARLREALRAKAEALRIDAWQADDKQLLIIANELEALAAAPPGAAERGEE
jgi:hypothetical protein